MFAKSAIVVALWMPLSGADVTVHEWGTFTSVAGEEGTPMYWSPLTAPADLPCFVNHLRAQCIKCGATVVRMETPVLYFYSPAPATVSVRVDFPNGLITEWYPRAAAVLPTGQMTSNMNGRIDWGKVEIAASGTGDFPNDGSPSHYYAARATDSAALRVNGEEEKLLFYRGVASEGVFVEPQWQRDGKLLLRRAGGATTTFALLFENRDGRIGYRIVRDLNQPVALDPPELNADVNLVHQELAEALTTAGLYPKEAAAMIETWRDSWFEEGMRVFYLVPRPAVDFMLPLKIAPAPAATTRVFVGRVEVLSPHMRRMIGTALANSDTATLAKCGRFLDPFLAMMGRTNLTPAVRAFMNQARVQAAQTAAPCKAEPYTVPTGQQLQ